MSTIQYSIIIPTYNRAQTLALTLDSVCNQTLLPENYEILAVDDGSTDTTKEIIFDFQKKYPHNNIRYFYEQNGGPAKARNLGIKESKGEIIFFTDDDCVVPPNWMEMLLDGYIRHPEVVGVGGWHEIVSRRSFLEKCLNAVDNKFGSGILSVETKTNLHFYPYLGAQLANLSYKKSILEKCGRFDENLISETWMARDLTTRSLSGDCSFFHLPINIKRIKDIGIKDLFYQYAAEGKDLFYLHRKRPKLISDIYGDFLNNFLRVVSHFEFSHFYVAYFFSTLLRIGGRIFAKYWNRMAVKEVNILTSETFEISKYPAGEKKTIQTSGRPFDKSSFCVKEPLIDFYSIVIPTYNRSQGLIRSLENLVSQAISSECYEIVVVDDGSTDDTEAQITNYKVQNTKYNIRYFKTENGGPAKARNRGIKEAKGEIIFFTDDDCIVPPNWIETLLDGYKRYPDVVGVGGWHVPPEGELEKSAVSRFLHFESFFRHPIVGKYIRSHEILSSDPLMCFGNFAYNTANICYKKEILKAVGGFREDFYWPGGEDNELAFRIASVGHSLLYLPFHVTHPKAMSLPEFTKLHFRRGANGYLLRIMHQKLLEKLKPGFVKDYGSMASFTSRLSGPEKFLAFLEWLSLNAGIIYMKNKLAEHNNPIFPKPKEKIGND